MHGRLLRFRNWIHVTYREREREGFTLPRSFQSVWEVQHTQTSILIANVNILGHNPSRILVLPEHHLQLVDDTVSIKQSDTEFDTCVLPSYPLIWHIHQQCSILVISGWTSWNHYDSISEQTAAIQSPVIHPEWYRVDVLWLHPMSECVILDRHSDITTILIPP